MTARKTAKPKAAKKPAAKKTASKAKKPAPKMSIAKPQAKAPVRKIMTASKPVVTPVESAPIARPIAATINSSKMGNSLYQRPQMQKPSTPIMDTKAMVVAENDNVDFTKGDFVVYPAHGVGMIEGIETHTIGGMQISLYAISFEKDRMRLKIPVVKARASGLRKLSTSRRLKDAIETLQGRARIRRTMWSRRAQEYETKINSGDPIAIAEVLRDLKRSNDDSEQSYSERQIYQSALERLAREFAAIKNIPEMKATEQLEDILGTSKNKEAA